MRELLSSARIDLMSDLWARNEGYIPGGEALQVVGDLARSIKEERAKSGEELIYVLDREHRSSPF